jgi:hypothetical protein
MKPTELALEVQIAARHVRAASKATDVLEKIVSAELAEMDVDGRTVDNPNSVLSGCLKLASEALADAVDVLRACGMFAVASYDEQETQPRLPFKTVKEQAADAKKNGAKKPDYSRTGRPKPVRPPEVEDGDAAHPWR